MTCKRCHMCGTGIRIVLDGEEWCPTCETYQRPASHGWGRRHDQTVAEQQSCEDSEQNRVHNQLSRLATVESDLLFDLYICKQSDLDEHNDGWYALQGSGLRPNALLAILCVHLYRGTACQVIATKPTTPPSSRRLADPSAADAVEAPR